MTARFKQEDYLPVLCVCILNNRRLLKTSLRIFQVKRQQVKLVATSAASEAFGSLDMLQTASCTVTHLAPSGTYVHLNKILV